MTPIVYGSLSFIEQARQGSRPRGRGRIPSRDEAADSRGLRIARSWIVRLTGNEAGGARGADGFLDSEEPTNHAAFASGGLAARSITEKTRPHLKADGRGFRIAGVGNPPAEGQYRAT